MCFVMHQWRMTVKNYKNLCYDGGLIPTVMQAHTHMVHDTTPSPTYLGVPS